VERPTPYVEVRVTAPDAATATRLARLLVEERLAACVQVVPGISSVYRWKDTVEAATEHLLLVKSTADRFEAIRARVRAEHPYDTPEVLAVPVVAADARYAAWLDASTEASGGTDDTDGSEGGPDGGVERGAAPDGGGSPRR
jgi:periplasmic divalent cation tolerance protein